MAAKHRPADVFDLLALARASVDVPVVCAMREVGFAAQEQGCAATPG
jgi:hypothetical protein